MVERTNIFRRDQRANAALPYKRPSTSSKRAGSHQPSFFSAISDFFSSFWRKGDEDEDVSDNQEDNIQPEPAPVADALVERGLNMQAGQATMPQYPTNHMFQQPPPQQPPPPAAAPPPPPPAVAPTPEVPRVTLSPPSNDRSSNIETVTTFLAQNAGRTINPMEVQGILSLLQEVKEPEVDRPVPFRFSTTPTRDETPAPTTQSNKPPRMLTKNPNGTCVWRGAGSAKPRNRYSAPGFSSSRPPQVGMKLAPAKPKTDGKRRRLDNEPEEATPQAGPSSLAPPNGAVPQPNGHGPAPAVSSSKGPTTTSVSFHDRSPSPAAQPAQRLTTAGTAPASLRLRTTLKPTTPAVPSPLRQTWGQADSPSPPAPPRQTRAANIISALVKETAPKPPSIFTNPYEAAHPNPPRPVRKPLPKKKKATDESSKAASEAAKAKVEAPKEPEPEVDLSPQRIIEATMPKGAKRSRPPPELIKQKEQPLTEAGPRRSARLKSPEPSGVNGISHAASSSHNTAVTIEEVPDEGPSPKKVKPNGVVRPLQPPFEIPERSAPVIEEVTDAEPATQPKPDTKVVLPAQIIEPEPKGERNAPSAPPASTFNPFNSGLGPKSGLGAKSSAPKAPSKLRYSIQADSPKEAGKDLPSPSSASSSFAPAPAAPVPAPAATASPFAAASTSKPSASALPSAVKKATPKTTEDIKALVTAMPVTDLPQYTFDFPLSSPGAGPSVQKAKAAAKAIPVSALPTYDFTIMVTSTAPASGFDWAAAGLKVPSKPADNWDCSLCGLSNTPAASKCTVCEAARPGGSTSTASTAPAAPPAAVSGFNWAAAGMTMPSKPANTWDCSTCGLSNPLSASKCTVCEAAKPGGSSATTSTAPAAPAPTSGFNWAAAGVQPPPAAAGWTCSTCMVPNSNSANKCIACESPR